MPPKKTAKNTSYPCLLCDVEDPPLYPKNRFRQHLVDEHQFVSDNVIHGVLEGTNKRILFPKSAHCPVCSLRINEFTDHSFGAHIRRPHPNRTEFEKLLADGAYFWWTESEAGHLPISTAFKPVNPLLLKQFTTVDVREAVLEPEEEHVALGIDETEGDALLEETNHMQETFNEDTQMVVEEEPQGTIDLPVFVHVEHHPALSQFGMALLSLVDFPGQPVIVVCTECRIGLTPTKVNLRQHSLSHEAVAQEDIPEIPEEDVESDIEEYIKPVPAKRRNRDLNSLALFVESNTLFSLLSTIEFPSLPIAEIPFLQLQHGFKCPTCTTISKSEKTITTHIHKHHATHDTPLPILVQQLIPSGTSASQPFQVIQQEMRTTSEIDLLSSVLQSVDIGSDVAHSSLLGIQHRNPFIYTFKYEAIFPENINERQAFVQSRLVPTSLISGHNSEPKWHLLHVTAAVYVFLHREHLKQAPHLIRRQIGNRLLSHVIDREGDDKPMNVLARVESVLSYIEVMSLLLAYITGVVDDHSRDTGLELCEEQVDAFNTFSFALDHALSPSILEKLEKVKALPKYVSFEDGLKIRELDDLIPFIVRELLPYIHSCLYSLVIYPQSNPLTRPHTVLPITRFLALMSWHTNFKSFVPITNCRHIMARVQWLFRMAVFVEAMSSSQEDDAQYNQLLLLHDRYLLKDSLTQFGNLQDQMRHASMLAITATAMPVMSFDHSTETAYHNGHPIPFHQFKHMIHSLLAEAAEIMNKHLLMGLFPDFNPPSPIVDDIREGRAGYSYFFQNPYFQRPNYILKKILADPTLAEKWISSISPSIVWKSSTIQNWLSTLDRFIDILIMLIYLGSGGPWRRMEITELRVCNIDTQMRSVFCVQGNLALHQNYAKQVSDSSKPQPVVRIPLFGVQDLIQKLVTLVYPFARQLMVITGIPSPEIVKHESLLFTNRGLKYTPDRLSHVLRVTTGKFLGHGFGVGPLRHIMISFQSELLPKEIREMLMYSSTVMDYQAAHGARASINGYALSQETSFLTLPTRIFVQQAAFSSAWHTLLGCTHPRLPQTFSPTHEAAQQPTFDYHRLANLTADTLLVKQQQVAVNVVAKERAISNATSKVLDLDSIVQPATLSLLKRMYAVIGETITSFRSIQQAQSVEYCVNNNSAPLIAILPTGHGKSLLYLLPIFQTMEANILAITLLIVPLRSLADSAAQTAAKFGIPATVILPGFDHNENQPSSEYRLVIVTPDLLFANHSFKRWVQKMGVMKLLKRIVIDEAHCIFTEGEANRQCYTWLCEFVANNELPALFLSGTLSLTHEQMLVQQLRPFPFVYLTRLSTERANISYRVYPSMSIPEFIDNIRNNLFPELEEDPEQRSLIFVRTIKVGIQIAEGLGVELYQSQSNPGSADNEALLRNWLDPQQPDLPKRIIVATSALSVGVDYPNIRSVSFYGTPFEFVTLAQQSARAGRDGKNAFIHVVPCKDADDQHLCEFLTTSSCRRLVFSKVFDRGYATCASIPFSNPCDNCQEGHSQPHDPPLPLSIARRTSEEINILRLETVQHLHGIVEWYSRLPCVFCNEHGVHKRHDSDCPTTLHFHRSKVQQALAHAYQPRGNMFHIFCPGCYLPHNHVLPGSGPHHAAVLEALSATSYNGTHCCQSGFSYLVNLVEPCTHPPFDAIDRGRTLLHIHFLILTLAMRSPLPCVIAQDFAKSAAYKAIGFELEDDPPIPLMRSIFAAERAAEKRSRPQQVNDVNISHKLGYH